MSIRAYLRSLSSKFFRGSQTAADMDNELQSHIQLRADDLERSGLTRAEAERRARIEFGGRDRYREECNQQLGGNFLETTLHDIRYGARVLRKSPGFTFVAIATLALAIGANALVFGVLNALILRPLNVPQADSLYGIEHGINGYESYPNYLDLRDRNRTFEQLAAFTIDEVGLDTGKDPMRAWTYEVTGNYFDALGIQPYLGRVIHASDEHGTDSAPCIVLSHAFWHSHFHDDPSVVGRTVQLNRHPFTIVGVTPPEFQGTLLFFTPDMFVPIVDHRLLSGEGDLDVRRKDSVFEILGHLKPGVTTAQAVSDLTSIGAFLLATYPKDVPNIPFKVVRPALYGNFIGAGVLAFVSGLTVLAALILLASCANLGSLFAARAADRAREVALRLALGSSRTRILRQLMTEAMLISIAGGSVGLLASIALLRQLSVWQPFPRFPLRIPVSPDSKVYFVALLLALVSGILFGIVPVRQVFRINPYEVVKAGSTRVVGRRLTARDILLVVQIAICAVLVTSSMVAVRGLVRSLHSSFGFQPDHALIVDVPLGMAGYTSDSIPTTQRRLIDLIETISGVESVAITDLPPLNMDGHMSDVFNDATTDLRPANSAATSYVFNVSPKYFEAAGTTLQSGRGFTWHDDQDAPRVAVVNRRLANRLFGSGTNPVDKVFKLRDGTRAQVVGVVEDGKYLNLTEDQKPALFLPLLQSPAGATWMILRSNRDPQQMADAIRNKLHEMDEGLPVSIVTWNKQLEGVLFPMRMATLSLGILGVMGAMLSITGIFGMAAYSVSKRLRELGIRVALGARREEVLRAALGRAVRLLAIGSVAGLVLGILATRVLASIVYQASPRDPLVLAGAIVAMALLGLIATWFPALRALHVEPMLLLREE